MAKIVMPTISNELKRLGLTGGGKTQLFATNEAKRLMQPYVPVQNHALRQSARIVDNGTAVEYQSPYAHYQYRGVLYVDPITGKGSFFKEGYGHWSRKGVDKVKSDRELKYSNPNASKEWDKKMMQEKGKEYIQAIQDYLDKEYKK